VMEDEVELDYQLPPNRELIGRKWDACEVEWLSIHSLRILPQSATPQIRRQRSLVAKAECSTARQSLEEHKRSAKRQRAERALNAWHFLIARYAFVFWLTMIAQLIAYLGITGVLNAQYNHMAPYCGDFTLERPCTAHNVTCFWFGRRGDLPMGSNLECRPNSMSLTLYCNIFAICVAIAAVHKFWLSRFTLTALCRPLDFIDQSRDDSTRRSRTNPYLKRTWHHHWRLTALPDILLCNPLFLVVGLWSAALGKDGAGVAMSVICLLTSLASTMTLLVARGIMVSGSCLRLSKYDAQHAQLVDIGE